MKRLLALFFLVIFTVAGYCQNLINEDYTWYMMRDTGAYQHPSYISAVYRVAGDTLIENRLYKKFEYTLDTSKSVWIEDDNTFLRYDSGKYYKNYFNEDRIFIDYSWTKDQTVNIMGICPGRVRNFFIDSTNGVLRNLWHLDLSGPTSVLLLEEVGFFEDHFYENSACMADAPHEEFACLYKKDSLVYKRGNFSCYINPLTLSNDFTKPNVKIFPNPGNDNLNIKSDGLIQNVSVIDISGSVCLQKSRNLMPSILLDISGLISGIYTIQIVHNNGRRSNHKWVKM